MKTLTHRFLCKLRQYHKGSQYGPDITYGKQVLMLEYKIRRTIYLVSPSYNNKKKREVLSYDSNKKDINFLQHERVKYERCKCKYKQV